MKKEKINGLIGTVIFHLVILAILLLVVLTTPQKQEEGGVPVMLGSVDEASGDADPMTMTDVDITDEPLNAATEDASQVPSNSVPDPNELITQEEEKSVEVKKSEKVITKQPVKQEVVKPKELTEAEKKAIKEKKEAQERAEKEKAAALAAQKKISGAFGKGTNMGSTGNSSSGSGNQGSPTGNSDHGKTSGIGGYGSFDLNGRSLGSGSLPVPVYNVQDEGRVVVTIVVNPAGQVISTSINKKTNTINASLRKAAENAAKKAKFNVVSGVNNQTGTITYNFKLR